MKNIVIATKPNVGYYEVMVESCKRNNIELVVLGMGKPWNGLSDKYKYWIGYLETLPKDEIVMLNDAYDVIILDSPENIISKFKAFNKPVVFSVQKGLAIDFVFTKYFDSVACTGNIIGYVKNILHILQLVVKNKDLWLANSDQIIFNEVIIREPYLQQNIAIDTDRTLFYVTSISHFSFKKDIRDLKMENGKLFNINKQNKQPHVPISILHLAAAIDGKKYIEYLGYNTNSLIKPTGGYKTKQVIEYIKYVFYKNRKKLLIHNCSFILVFLCGIIYYILNKKKS